MTMNGIASRLLLKEIEAQERISRMMINVQKGSLIQALLYDEENNSLVYLLAKVEHTEWVDDSDFSFKTGFPKDKKTLWKSCLFNLHDLNATEFQAKIYSNTVVKYWSDNFLELDEMNPDETNTTRALSAVDTVLNQNFRKLISPDHTILRNHTVGYLINNDHIDYPTMIEAVFGNYQPVDPNVSSEKIQEIKEKLLQQPGKKNFDSQFNAINSAINVRIRKVYPINDGIDIRVNQAIPDGMIRAIEDASGARYIQVRTNNEDTFKKFRF